MKNILTLAAAAAVLAGCGGGPGDPSQTSGEVRDLTGQIIIDGSSTVAPISEAVAEEFLALHPRVRITVGTSGSGGGFKKFLNRETDISDASRPIKESELELAAKNGVEYIEIPIAYDGLSVMVHPENTWVDYFTVEELKRIWEPGSQVNRWSQVRAGWPDRPIKLYGAGQDSGTYDYFTEAIVGKEGSSRQDFTGSEDDNVLVMGISQDRDSLGFFGYAYYVENKDKLKVVPIDGGDGPVAPSAETIEGGRYAPLSRPLFIYIRADVADTPVMQEFVRYYLSGEGRALITEVGYVPLAAEMYEIGWNRFESRILGTAYPQGSHLGMTLKDIYAPAR